MNYKVLLFIKLLFIFINIIVSNDIGSSKDICKSGSPALVGHECDCSLFYNCAASSSIVNDSKQVLKKCPYGLHFNSQLLLCDDPKKVNCKLDCSKKELLSIRLPNLDNILNHH